VKKLIFCTLIALSLLAGVMPGCTGLVPNQAADYYNKGVALANEGKYDEAIAEYNKAIEIDQNYTNAYVNLGYAYLMKKQYDLSITNYTKAIELDPEQKTAYNGRGAAYLYTKRYNSAAADFNKSIELDPSATQTYTNRDYVANMLNQATLHNTYGVNLAEIGNYAEAFDSFSQAVEVYPYYPAAYTNRGILLVIAEQYDSAITEFNSAIQLNSDYALAYSGRGLAYIYTEDYEEAVTDVDKALQIDPDEASDWNNKGIALEQLGELEEAADAYDRALQLEPNNQGIQNNITVIREAGIPKGVKGHYFGPLPYGIEKAAEQRTTETEFEPFTEPPPANPWGGTGLVVKTLTGTWVSNSPYYGLSMSDGGSTWYYDVIMRLEETDPNTGGLHVHQPCTFTGTMQMTLQSITGPATTVPDFMSQIGTTSEMPVSGTRDGSVVNLNFGGGTHKLIFDVDYLYGDTELYDAASYVTWTYSFHLRRS